MFRTGNIKSLVDDYGDQYFVKRLIGVPGDTLAVQGTGVTICLIEHVMKAILGLSDKVIVLNHGEKIAEGPPQEVANDPQVIAAYLGQKRPA